MRVGIGYDYHRTETGRPLILGGVEIPHELGLQGHSDGDVLSHAVCDAILGAAGLGDIGRHFSDSDPKWRDAHSSEFFAHINGLLRDKGLRVVNVDTVIIAQEPHLAPHFDVIRRKLAEMLGVGPEAVNIKAKTTEGLETTGRGEAMAAHAVVLLERPRAI